MCACDLLKFVQLSCNKLLIYLYNSINTLKNNIEQWAGIRKYINKNNCNCVKHNIYKHIFTLLLNSKTQDV